jgi:uncharacterized protein with NRDE domain
MCLILFSFDENAETPLIVAANRDEFFARPSATAHYWNEHPELLAGKDLVANGTWLGITRSGRFAATTNVREPNVVVENPLSRGDLTRHFLTGTETPAAYLASIQDQQHRFSGFNLVVGEITDSKQELFYMSNRREGVTRLSSGIYGLSNHLLDSDWPKVRAGKRFLTKQLTLATSNDELHDRLRQFLEDDSLAPDAALPQTGVSYDREKALSAAFIRLPDYGTRTSTVLTLSNKGGLLSEKNYVNRNPPLELDPQVRLFHW